MSSRPRIYAMETTNFCNASCNYCPHTKMSRKLGMCSMQTADKVLNYCKQIGQKYIALHHMGEPLLHRNIDLIIKNFEDAKIRTEFSTNGFLLKRHGLSILNSGLTRLRIAVDFNYESSTYQQNLKEFLSISRDFETDIRIHTIENKDLRIFEGINPKATLENKPFDNWAGALDEASTLNRENECYFLKYNYVVVLWDGNIVPCCMDYDGKYAMSHIDFIRTMGRNTRKEKLCRGCANMQFADGGEWTK